MFDFLHMVETCVKTSVSWLLQGYAILDIRRNEATTTWYYAPELTKAGQ